jgi:biopolymer transport protein ExbD
MMNSENDESEPELVEMPPRPPMEDEMDITPMIDLTFLLLIFFILTSKMTGEKTYDVPPAKNGSSVSSKICVTLLVTRGAGDTPIVARADGSVFAEDPEQQAAEIEEYLLLELESGRKTEVLIRAEGNVTSGQMKKIKQVVSEILEEGKMLNIAVSESS